MKLLAIGTIAFDAIETPFGKTDKIDTINNIIILVIELFLFKVLFFKEEKNKLNEMKLKYGLTKLNKEKLFKKKKFLILPQTTYFIKILCERNLIEWLEEN